jgi:hypothetical protein
MSVSTVYCHGTGFDCVKVVEENELVAWFHATTAASKLA